jgi:hypothetical protein
VLAGFPSSTTAGVAHSFTVTVKDPYGNLATGYTGTVRFSSTDPQGVLPANAPLTNGTGTFTVTLKTAGARSLTAADAADGRITDSQSGLVVTPAAASTLVAADFPSSTTAGVAHSFTVTAQDPYGNTATGYTGTVRFSSTDPRAVLPANARLFNGTGTFTDTLKTPGPQSLTGADTTDGRLTGAQSGIMVAPAVPYLQIEVVANVATGLPFDVVVTAWDEFGDIDVNYRGTVSFSVTDLDSGVVLPDAYTFTEDDGGVHTFTAAFALLTLGPQVLTVGDADNGFRTDVSVWVLDSPVIISPPPPAANG